MAIRKPIGFFDLSEPEKVAAPALDEFAEKAVVPVQQKIITSARRTLPAAVVREVEQAEALVDEPIHLVEQLRRIAEMHSNEYWSRYLLECSDTISAQYEAIKDFGLPDKHKVAQIQRMSLGAVEMVYDGIRELQKNGSLIPGERITTALFKRKDFGKDA